jgi:Xaa-Pro dipeptidase
MTSSLTLAERDRRWSALQKAMEEEGFDALVFVANDYRGHKGSLRYVCDYNLPHRYGYAVMGRGRDPSLILGAVAGRYPKNRWMEDIRYVRKLPAGVVDALRELPERSRVGVVGMLQVMRVEEYLYLLEELPDTRFEEANHVLERVRTRKSPEEIRGLEEAAYIGDRCVERLYEISRPGLTEREIGAEMYRTAAMLGAEDFLFLTMYAVNEGGEFHTSGGAPRDRVLHPNDQFVFSFEFTGALGFWIEMSRAVVFSRPTEAMERVHRAVSEGLDAVQATAKAGARSGEVQDAIVKAARAHGGSVASWTGHGIGQDVIEEPWFGREVVQESDATRSSDVLLEDSMAVTLHPYVVDDAHEAVCYMADTFVVGTDGARKLSELPLDLHRPHLGS